MSPDSVNSETAQTVGASQLRAFVERAERLYGERRDLDADLKDLWAEAKGTGYSVKAMKTLIRLRRQDAAQRQEEEAILDLYKAALGME